ncbi:MAG: hypothetical protein PVJ21_16685 [Anaerolineales bacterium]|jgi:hypothetical protein
MEEIELILLTQAKAVMDLYFGPEAEEEGLREKPVRSKHLHESKARRERLSHTGPLHQTGPLSL